MPGFLERQHGLRVGAVSAHRRGERCRRAQLMATIVEPEEIVEEVVRANTRKAVSKKVNVSLLLLGLDAEQRNRSLVACTAVHDDETGTLHPNKATAHCRCATLLTQTHRCNARRA